MILARPGGQRDPEYLVRTLIEREITILQVVPTQLKALLGEADLRRATRLRRLFCAGEALESEWATQFCELLSAELVNTYGVTEAAIDSTAWRHQPETPFPSLGGSSVPIGRPIANNRVYLLDRDGMPVPSGVAGELHIAGVAPGRGYIFRPGLTAERFVPDAWSGQPGARAYRTGDLARFLPTGAVEYLGRMDDQIKLRGFRIELGEVAAALEAHPGVREAVVVLGGQGLEERRLLAYLVAAGGAAPDLRELRGFLGSGCRTT